MNIYRIIAVLLMVIFLAEYFDIAESIKAFLEAVLDIPKLMPSGSNDGMFQLAVRLCYLIALLGALKLMLRRQ